MNKRVTLNSFIDLGDALMSSFPMNESHPIAWLELQKGEEGNGYADVDHLIIVTRGTNITLTASKDGRKRKPIEINFQGDSTLFFKIPAGLSYNVKAKSYLLCFVVKKGK